MGVKHTVDLTHEEAVERAVDLYAAINRRKIAAQFYIMDNSELETELMRMNDEYKGGEGFENYNIRDSLW